METVVCDFCGTGRYRVVLRYHDEESGSSSAEYTVVRCEDCGLQYLNPRPTCEEIGQFYPDLYFASTPPKIRGSLKQRIKGFSEEVKRWIREDFYGYPTEKPRTGWAMIRKVVLWPEKVRREWRGRHILPWVGRGLLLDVGCSTGMDLKSLQDQGWDVRGLDLSEVAAAQARARIGDRIIIGTLETAPLEQESFDVVRFTHSLEHMFSPLATLVRVWELLRPGGVVVITLPNVASLEARIFGPCWWPWELPRHLYHFDRNTLVAVLQRARFRVTHIRTGVGSLFFMASLERAVRQRFGRSLPLRCVVEKLFARPFCFLAGHMGHGTDITVYAVKEPT